MLALILLVLACACFALNTFAHGVALNLDQLGKAFVVGAVIAYQFASV